MGVVVESGLYTGIVCPVCVPVAFSLRPYPEVWNGIGRNEAADGTKLLPLLSFGFEDLGYLVEQLAGF